MIRVFLILAERWSAFEEPGPSLLGVTFNVPWQNLRVQYLTGTFSSSVSQQQQI